MKFEQGWYFPDDEQHLPQVIQRQSRSTGLPGYQVRSRQQSLFNLHGVRRRVAIDVGANVGLWARDLCQEFERVIAFEPIQEFRECLEMNVKSPNLFVDPRALGNRTGSVEMVRVAGNAGHTHVNPASIWGTTEIVRLDDLSLEHVDYIKIDCEGYEREVLEGAAETIQRCRPRICVEQKPHGIFGEQYRARDLLISWGMLTCPHHGDDWVLDWRPA
jgi:FkbM family methyltransferase